MISLTIGEIAEITSGHISRGEPGRAVSGIVTTDSREITPGGIFVAKPGEFTDGFLFIPNAIANGATLVLSERPSEHEVDCIVVDDAVVALGALASEVVRRVKALGQLRIVGITGSNGKTTTKNLLRAILSPLGETVAPRASFNNEVGAPTTFLELTESTRYLVAEMGASHIGDIAALTAMAPPDIGVVLKVGLAHVGEFGGIENTFRAKSEMVTSLHPGAVAILNYDDVRVRSMAELAPGRVRFFGTDEAAEVRASDVELHARGTRFVLHTPGEVPRTVNLQVLGEHHVLNALAAITAALELGVDLDHAIRALEAVSIAEKGRMELIEGRGLTIIHDAYNASPDSMHAALKTLAQLKPADGRSFAVLGAMSELGDQAGEEHDRIGTTAVRLRIDQLVVVGVEARRIHVSAVNEGAWNEESIHVLDNDAAFAYLTESLQPGDVVLLKASNSAGLHQLAERLREWVA